MLTLIKIYIAKKMNNKRPKNGTSWYSFMTNAGFKAFYFTRGREKREKGREAGGSDPPVPPPPYIYMSLHLPVHLLVLK